MCVAYSDENLFCVLRESIQACHYGTNCTQDKYLLIYRHQRTYLLIKVLNTRFLYLCLSMFISLVREMTYLSIFVTHLP